MTELRGLRTASSAEGKRRLGEPKVRTTLPLSEAAESGANLAHRDVHPKSADLRAPWRYVLIIGASGLKADISAMPSSPKSICLTKGVFLGNN